MKIKEKLFTLIAIFVVLSVANAAQPADPVKNVVNEFYKQYLGFLKKPVKGNYNASLIAWVKTNSLLTMEYKRKFEEAILQARKEDPELGLGYDPIINAQDYPDEGFHVIDLKISGKRATTIGEGIGMPSLRIRVELIEIKGKWFINGIGNINTSKNKKEANGVKSDKDGVGDEYTAGLNSPKSDEVKRKFDLYYASWMKECERPEVVTSSQSYTYTNLSSFRNIVALGRPALPYLKEKMEKGNFLLAYAVIEILGWTRSDFHTDTEQGFRDMVLERMKPEKIAQ
jgi:hypothetical protein